MRERRERVHGPYRRGNKWRVVVVVGSGGESDRSTEPFESEEEAREFIAKVERGIAERAAEVRTVKTAVDAFIASQDMRIKEGEIGAKAVERYEYHLRKTLKLATEGHHDLKRLTPAFGRKLYEERTGAVDTHRNGLSVAKMFGNWCVSKGWLKLNPFAGIKGKGRRRRGKPKLRHDEARTVYFLCLELADHDVGAVVTLAYLLLGTRADELLSRDVRDLDDGGRLLWIPETKSEAGKRALELPDELVPHFVRLAEGRPALAPLIEACAHRRRRQDWAREQVTRICKLAGVPRVTPHGLRGTQGTLAAEAGATSKIVAASLGHASPAITERAYLDMERVNAAKRRASLRVLTGGAA